MSFVEGKNYYEILGVERDASVDEIKSAYKEIARVYHPDSNFYADLVDQSLSNSHLEIFQEITAAYNTLANKNKRVEYDKSLAPELRGWSEQSSEEEDQELLEALEKIGVNPESVGVTAKPRRKRKNSEAFGVFGTQIQAGSSEASLGSIQAQYGVSGFRHAEEAFPKPKRPTLTNIMRPQVVDQQRPADGGIRSQTMPHNSDTKIKLLLLIFVGTGSFCFAMSVVAFLMLR